MAYHDADSRTRWRKVVALVLAFWIVVAGAEWVISCHEESPHGPHELTASLYGGFAVAADHPHIENHSTHKAPDAFAEAMLPRGATVLIALALMAAIATVAPFWRQGSLGAIRGPPRWQQPSESGRVLLTRLCIARR